MEALSELDVSRASVVRDGRLRLSATTELTANDYLPLPPDVPLAADELSAIDLFDVFDDTAEVEAHSPEALDWTIARAGWRAYRRRRERL